MRIFDPRKLKLRQWSLKAIIADSHLYQQFSNVGESMVLVTKSLLNVAMALVKEFLIEP